MKKTLTVNLNGRVFNIDEDAYELLDNYLRNLRIYFRKEEGSNEIIADFEARIEELFSERIRLGHEVITTEHVEAVIVQVGKPEDFGVADETEPEMKESKNQSTDEKKVKRKLYRDIDDKMFAGICSGLAAYFGVDATPIRLIVIVLLVISSGSIIMVYLIMWLIIPAAKTAEQKLKMKGEEVTLENIGKVVSSETSASEKKNENGLGWVVDIVVAILKFCLVGVGILVGIPILFALFIVAIVLFSLIAALGGGLVSLPFGLMGTNIANITADHPTMAMIASILVLGIPVVLLVYSIIAHFGKLNPMPKSVKLGTLAVWIIALIVLLSSGINLNLNDMKHWKPGRWNVSWGNSNNNRNTIEGNGVIDNRVEELTAFEVVELEDGLLANVQLEQDSINPAKIQINGDSNIIDKITWRIENNKLTIAANDQFHLEPKTDIIIKVNSPVFKGIKVESIGNVSSSRKLQTPDFFVELEGAGNFQLDSLYCTSFRAEMKGVGQITTSGKVTNADLYLEGAGKINSIDLEAKEVHAVVKGIGEIKCNPVDKIDASVEGIGRVAYKNEPAVKNTHVDGLGHIGKD